MSGQRLLWSFALLYAAGSAGYAITVLFGVLVTGHVEESLAGSIVIFGHILLFLFAREGWDRFADNRWKGFLRVSDGTQRVIRAGIRLFAGSLLLAGVLLVLAVRFLEFRLDAEGVDRLAALGVGAAILFGSVVYGSCSLFGGDSIASRAPGLWQRILKRLGRAQSRRNRRRDHRGRTD
jgi:hypothetical protein